MQIKTAFSELYTSGAYQELMGVLFLFTILQTRLILWVALE